MPTTDSMQPAGLYIHIPFCRKKCSYCDFFSISDPSLQPEFVDALLAEIHLTAERMPAVDTVYIGGGTPSVLPADSLRRILSAVRNKTNLLPDAERLEHAETELDAERTQFEQEWGDGVPAPSGAAAWPAETPG